MSMHNDVVVVVTACDMQSFRIHHEHTDTITAQQCGVFPLDYTVGSAQSLFYTRLPSDASPTLFVCICGFDGIFVYAISMDQLLAPQPDTGITTIWGLTESADGPEASEYDRSDDRIFQPLFGKYSPTLSWLLASYRQNRPIRFATLPICLQDRAPLDNSAASLPEYRLDHADLPALYALGVYDYHEVMGLAVFGNAFGELVLFNIGGIDLSKSTDYLGTLRLCPVSEGCDPLSEVRTVHDGYDCTTAE